jgi:hypothetical protein
MMNYRLWLLDSKKYVIPKKSLLRFYSGSVLFLTEEIFLSHPFIQIPDPNYAKAMSGPG